MTIRCPHAWRVVPGRYARPQLVVCWLCGVSEGESVVRNKYGNVKQDGAASTKEARRHLELIQLQKMGKIADLRTQVVFDLIPAQRDLDGKVLERSVKYVADFVYNEQTPDWSWRPVVEDCKGIRTRSYIIKRKLMLWHYKIQIRET